MRVEERYVMYELEIEIENQARTVKSAAVSCYLTFALFTCECIA